MWLPPSLPARAAPSTANGFKSIRDSPPAAGATWAFGAYVCYLLQGHPAHIRRRAASVPSCDGAYPVAARSVSGMARVRSGQAPAWPLVSDRSGRRGSGVKRDFACTLTRHSSPVLVVLRSQSRWRGGHVHSAGHPRI